MPELRGLEAVFDVSIKALKDSQFPALTEEFAQVSCSHMYTYIYMYVII